MRGVSGDSRAIVLERLDELLARDDADAERVGGELFTVTRVLDSSARLRRLVTDPATPDEAKTGLVRSILSGKVAEPVLDLMAEAVRQRWAASVDLADTLEDAGIWAQVSAAEAAGQGDELEDELFRFGRLVLGNRRLRDALTDRAAPLEGRRELVRTLLQARATSPTVGLVEQAVVARRGSFPVTLEQFQDLVAERRRRLVATVRTAQPLHDADRRRLAAALARQYGRDVHLNVVVEPELLGGLRVEIGDDVIDGTVSSRLDDARRGLAG